MASLLYAVAVGLAGAGFVHAAIALTHTDFMADRVWGNVSKNLPTSQPVRLNEARGALPAESPFLLTSVCRFHMGDGPARIRAIGRVAGWTATFSSPDGRNIASLNDRMAGGKLDLSIKQVQSEARDRSPDHVFEGPFRLAMDGAEGLLAVRVLVPDPSWRPLAESFLSTLSCARARDER